MLLSTSHADCSSSTQKITSGASSVVPLSGYCVVNYAKTRHDASVSGRHHPGRRTVFETWICLGCRPFGCKSVLLMLLQEVEWGSCSGSERLGHAQDLGSVALGSIS